MSIHLRYLEYGEYPKVAGFLDEYWARDHAYVKMPELFDWTFGRRDLWDHDGYSFAIAESEAGVVGILGGIPFLFNYYGQTSYGIWLVNWMVRPSDHHGGWGFFLLKRFARTPYNTIISFGINRDVARIYQAMRWKVIEDIPRYFFILPEATRRMATLLRTTYPDWDMEKIQSLSNAFILYRKFTTDTAAKSSLLEWDYWDNNGWKPIAAESIGAVRDSAYLTWRYLEHPFFKYRFIIVPEGDRLGLAVWRPETIRRVTPAGLEELDVLGRVIEFMPVSERNCEFLLSSLVSEVRSSGAIGADFFCYNDKIGKWLNKLGFLEVGISPLGKKIPSRFQPLDNRGGQIMAAVSSKIEPPSYPSTSGCHWYWTKSDSDQDRPN